MYHDQGHIPPKALAFDSAVNVTPGLPSVLTSVDHGTAFDIAWKGAANPDRFCRPRGWPSTFAQSLIWTQKIYETRRQY
jgi:hypothetical protein